MSMRIHLETELNCTAADAWNQVVRSYLLQQIAWPLICLRADGSQPLPDRWRHGSTVRIRRRLFGAIPWATRTLFFESVDDDARQIQTREHDRMIRRWDHLIRIRENGDGTAHDSDLGFDNNVFSYAKRS